MCVCRESRGREREQSEKRQERSNTRYTRPPPGHRGERERTDSHDSTQPPPKLEGECCRPTCVPCISPCPIQSPRCTISSTRRSTTQHSRPTAPDSSASSLPSPRSVSTPPPGLRPWSARQRLILRPTQTRATYGGLCGVPACGQAVGCGVCDTPELWRGAAGLCARVRACAGAAESVHAYYAPSSPLSRARAARGRAPPLRELFGRRLLALGEPAHRFGLQLVPRERVLVVAVALVGVAVRRRRHRDARSRAVAPPPALYVGRAPEQRRGDAAVAALQEGRGESQIGLHKILFHFNALLWESIILLLPPTCKAYPIVILLHDHYAIYAPLPTPPFMPYTIHYW